MTLASRHLDAADGHELQQRAGGALELPDKNAVRVQWKRPTVRWAVPVGLLDPLTFG